MGGGICFIGGGGCEGTEGGGGGGIEVGGSGGIRTLELFMFINIGLLSIVGGGPV